VSKLTKLQAKAHKAACEMLEQATLSEDEKEFVLLNWREDATEVNSSAGAFFTPMNLAFDFTIEVPSGRIIDLCAGVGMLSWALLNRRRRDAAPLDLTCIEINPAYVEVGRKVLPEARWICASVFDVPGMHLGRFDCAISNPPFGAVKRSGNAPRYAGKDFEFHVIDIASGLAEYGAFIVPQMSAGFRYSGSQTHERQDSGRAVEFQALTGLRFEAGCGVDTAIYLKDWRGVSPLCEIVCVEFDAPAVLIESASAPAPKPARPVASPAIEAMPAAGQLDLFGVAA